MNLKYSHVLALLALAAATSTAPAKTLEQAYLESLTPLPTAPLPIAVTAPDVDLANAGRTVRAEILVDAKGHPADIRILSAGADRELTAAVTSAVARWKFRPAVVNGLPVARTVVVPFHFVARTEPDRFALTFLHKAAE